jgi:hypothetical protein
MEENEIIKRAKRSTKRAKKASKRELLKVEGQKKLTASEVKFVSLSHVVVSKNGKFSL